MKRYTRFFSVLMLSFMLLLTACGGAVPNNGTNTGANTGSTLAPNAMHTTFSPYITTSPNAVLLSEDDAIVIALTHAGLASADTVSNLRTEFEVDDGVAYYEVSFRESMTAYDYDIHAESGAILSVDIDYDDARADDTAAKDAAITAEQAQNIALGHAKLDEAAVTGLRSEYDADDGRAHYDVSFYNGNYEYDYEIDAQTGDVISYDKDRED